ncbi:neural proliferation differentiation and control protein 1a isoform X2 [Cyclopterus lumpus]|uniref:neural proliferation differentiation and control protein 1a isoform X2 n=1 Tax=Cyclopterus lumpus TaxID=8103 RepID=UPI001486B958|nr:neural proliferation differentiation and control protein 1a isoform X2 [Cyclopterus lumpus]
MLLLSSPQDGRLRRASLLLLAAVLLCVVPVSARLPAGNQCPHHIDCAKDGRHFCRPGSSRCGPCLSPLEENKEGHCIVRKRHHQQGKVSFYPDLDEEIDYIHSVIEKQEVTEIKPPRQSKHPAKADVNKSKTDASKLQQTSQDRLLTEILNATTPAPAVSALPITPTPEPRTTGVRGRVGPIAVPASKSDNIIVIMISVCVVLGIVAVTLATVCYVKLQKDERLAQKVDYPAFKGAGLPSATTNLPSMGDKTLAQNAQMYHYQHQKQQMLSMGNNKPEQKVLDSEVTSDEEEVGGDFTVYECPGLAPTGEMEVKNPLFDDSTLHYQGNHK